ncbi:MAG: hypothetical protein IJF15_01405 [Oscillospiraceae bacterium]|nr:hypothetical protein [Oscillospiraceae bacterium]
MARMTKCDDCQYYTYDDEYDCFVCEMELDEDEMVHFLEGRFSDCPYYHRGDDYALARKQ